MTNSFHSTPTKPAILELNPQRQPANYFATTTTCLNTLASPDQSHPKAGAGSNPVNVHPTGGFREVITISFPTTEARFSSLKDLKAAKETRQNGMKISIKELFDEMQLEVSGPVG